MIKSVASLYQWQSDRCAINRKETNKSSFVEACGFEVNRPKMSKRKAEPAQLQFIWIKFSSLIMNGTNLFANEQSNRIKKTLRSRWAFLYNQQPNPLVRRNVNVYGWRIFLNGEFHLVHCVIIIIWRRLRIGQSVIKYLRVKKSFKRISINFIHNKIRYNLSFSVNLVLFRSGSVLR